MICSVSIWEKPVYKVRMEPNTATDTAATTMVRMLLPSHTIKRGARADLGRLFNRTRKGSSTCATLLPDHRSRAHARPKTVHTAKLIRVSIRVTPVWRNRLPSFAMETRHLAIITGELKMKLSIQCMSAASSHSARRRTSSMTRHMVTWRWRCISRATYSCWATDILQADTGCLSLFICL